jgi:hypothetical protein
MTLEEIYYVGQTIAVVAIVGSLIVLIMQNREAHQLARDSALRHQIEGLQNISRLLFETPGMADVWVRGGAGLDKLSPEDRVKFMAYMTYTLRIWEGLHAQFLRGQLGDELWRVHAKQLRDVQEFNGVKQM